MWTTEMAEESASSEKLHEAGYETPPIGDLLTLLLKNRRATAAYNEVWPNIYISDAQTARDKTLLRLLEVSHIVNAAHGPAHIDTGADFYSDVNIEYYGVEAPDNRDFDLSTHFYPAADFIHKALRQQGGGKVLVHCARGVSRSATLVLAYLMIYEKLTIPEAINVVRAQRNILPNAGFLQQLRQLDYNLSVQRSVGSVDIN